MVRNVAELRNVVQRFFPLGRSWGPVSSPEVRGLLVAFELRIALVLSIRLGPLLCGPLRFVSDQAMVDEFASGNVTASISNLRDRSTVSR